MSAQYRENNSMKVMPSYETLSEQGHCPSQGCNATFSMPCICDLGERSNFDVAQAKLFQYDDKSRNTVEKYSGGIDSCIAGARSKAYNCDDVKFSSQHLTREQARELCSNRWERDWWRGQHICNGPPSLIGNNWRCEIGDSCSLPPGY